MTQYALPDANLNTNSFTECVGDADSDWFDELDEGFGSGRGSGSGPDGLTTVWESGGNPQGETIETALSTVTDPAVSTGHIFRTNSGKYDGRFDCDEGQVGGRAMDLVITLRQGGADIASATFTDIGGMGTKTHTLTSGEADSITDYSDLEIESAFTTVGGGPSAHGLESAHEFECPDVAIPLPFERKLNTLIRM